MPFTINSSDSKSSPASDAPCRLVRDGILKQAYHRLRGSSYRELREVACEFHADVLTLRGRVGSYFVKQMAHVLVADVGGVTTVANRLDVGVMTVRS